MSNKHKKKKSSLLYYAKILIAISLAILAYGLILDLSNNIRLVDPKTGVKVVNDDNGSFTSVDSNPDNNTNSGTTTVENPSSTTNNGGNQGGAQSHVIDGNVNNTLRNALQQKFNILIKYGAETEGYSVGGLSTTAIYDDNTIYNALLNLNAVLSIYPYGFANTSSELDDEMSSEKSVLSKERSNNTPKNTINTNILSQLFLNTVSTYNFYWFISILQLLQKTKNSKLLVYDIVARMVANAWSPLICHNLEFGSSDSLKAITAAIQRYDLMPINTNVDQIFAILERYKKEYRIKRLLRVLTWNVPYRFLHPWIKTSDNKDLMYRSQHWENGCMYSLYMNDSEPYILINPIWMLYLLSHHKELLDFSCKSLSAFLLPQNPKIVNIEEIIAL